jgi:large subunit ribosomal protein L17
MKKRIKKYKLGRHKAHKEALLSNLASSLILNEYIVTTESKAKACQQYIDKLISKAKDGSEHAMRQIEASLNDRISSDKIKEVIAQRYKDREGGYTRIVRIKRRKGDNAQLVKLFFIDAVLIREKKKVKVKKSKKQSQKKKVDKKVQDQRKGVFGRVRELREKMGSRKGEAKVREEDHGKRSSHPEGVQKTRSGI